eukprot:309950-Prorocentrum_minimum.AAC.1
MEAKYDRNQEVDDGAAVQSQEFFVEVGWLNEFRPWMLLNASQGSWQDHDKGLDSFESVSVWDGKNGTGRLFKEAKN